MKITINITKKEKNEESGKILRKVESKELKGINAWVQMFLSDLFNLYNMPEFAGNATEAALAKSDWMKRNCLLSLKRLALVLKAKILLL